MSFFIFGGKLLILYTHNRSPYGRKVIIAAHVLHLIQEIEVRDVNSRDPNDPIRLINPLGKMPALVDEKEIIYDSRVILEYLNYKARDVSIFPDSEKKKISVLTNLARINGIMDAAVLIVYEHRLREKDKIVNDIIEYQRDKIIRSLKQIAREPHEHFETRTPNADEIGLACCLDYLDLRKQLNWREFASNLESWLESFSLNVPGYEETLPV